jgi:hypothetical protein
MIQIIHRLRTVRLLAVLAILLMAGFGPHVHGADSEDQATAFVVASMPDDVGHSDDTDMSPGTHCSYCHAVRAMLPDDAAHGAMIIVSRLPVLASELPAGLPAPDVPARPPRPGTA